jgi:glycosyltransferase involved in cell wall biosynthesis
MYQTVAQSKTHKLGWRGAFAKAISFAACANTQSARDAVEYFCQQNPPLQQRISLIDALVPFMPAEALKLIEALPNTSLTLRVAILLRNNRVATAQQLLKNASSTAFTKHPELHLYHTNAFVSTATEQLQQLNNFLCVYGISPLRLRDATQPPSPLNLVAIEPPAAIDGPLVTVLMTTFRTGLRAVAAIESVLQQNYHNIELIVVDDASGDETVTLLRSATKHDKRVRIVELPRNVGTYAAKSIGLAFTTGEFVTCHDSDDWSHPEKIARQVQPLLTNKRLVCTTSNWVRMQDDGFFYARPVHPLMRINPSSLLFRRKQVLQEAGAWDCVRTGADSEFLARLRVVFGSKAICKIKKPLALGSHRADSLMTAANTGHSDAQFSPQRLAYWEAWSHWHIDTLRNNKRPFISTDPMAISSSRPFDAPPEIQVNVDDVRECWNVVIESIR